MIRLLPSFHETLVLPRKPTDTVSRLLVSTSDKPFVQPDEAQLIFTGWVRPDRFRLSLRSRRHNHFLLLVAGTIDGTNSGCLLSLTYQLFPLTRLLLYGWTVLLLIGGLVAITVLDNLSVAFVVAIILVVMHAVTRSNFAIQLKLTRDAIHRIIA